MIKRIGRRFVSLLLTFVTILTMLPAMTLPALAATSGEVTGLSNADIGLSFAGAADNAWTAGGAQIIGKVRSTGGTGCGGSNKDYRSTLTITNKKNTKATLSFDYTVVVSGGTILVDNTTTATSGSYKKELDAGGTIEVEIESGSTSADTQITITNISLVVDVSATVTFQPAKNGSYTVNGKKITETYASTQSSTAAYLVEATPAKGYRFMGWYDVSTGTCINTNDKASLNFDSNCTMTARFASQDLALFEANGQKFDDLNDAIKEAQKNLPATITLVGSGKITGNYTIPSRVTLLIPFDEAKTCYTSTPTAITSTPTAKPFRALTMAAGSSLTLASGAAISVGGQYYAASGGASGKMVGPYGYIKMESGSAIDVQSGASLYAWGFISGSGSVTVQSGGSVYEWYQILDFRGGSASSQMRNKVFPFSQYAVQNIEVPLTVYAGASETAYTAVDAAGGIKPTSVPFIGNNGLFKLVSGSLTKAYDGETDRIHYTINGVAELNTLNLKLVGIKVDSSTYVLPLTNNMTVNLNSGSKLTVNQTAALLPGVEVSIARDAELEVPNGQSMYIYDRDEWVDQNFVTGGKFKAVPYAPGKHYTRTEENLIDVKVDVNGTLTANGGIYTTAGGADICSSNKTGKYVQEGDPGKENTTYQYTQNNSIVTAHKIPITAAQLHNADGTYTETKEAKAKDTFTYCTCAAHKGGEWVPDLQVAVICDSNGTPTMGPYPSLQDAVNNYTRNGNNYIKLLHDTVGDITPTSDLYLDLNGHTVTGVFKMSGNTLNGMDSSSKEYVAPKGKIVGSVSGYARTCQSPTVKVDDVDTYDRYVAILGNEDTTQTLSFHHFNISVTGYRFELAAPQCALFFIGKFRGDEAAKNHLKSLGFTLTDIAGETTNPRYDIPDVEKIPSESNPGESPVVLSSDGAFLFEAYLIREIDKGDSNTYQKQFSATAKATFNNSGVQDEDNSRSSVERKLSFWEAWNNATVLDETQKEILDKFLKALDIPNP